MQRALPVMQRALPVMQRALRVATLTVVWGTCAVSLGGCGGGSTPAPPTHPPDPLAAALEAIAADDSLDAVLARLEEYPGEFRFGPTMTEVQFAELAQSEQEALAPRYLAKLASWQRAVKTMRPCLADPRCPQRDRVVTQLRRWIEANSRDRVVELFARHAEATEALLRAPRPVSK